MMIFILKILKPSMLSIPKPSLGTLDDRISHKYGDITLDLPCNGTFPCRKLSIKELFDIMPIGSKVTLYICRNNDGVCTGPKCGLYAITAPFKYIASTIRYHIYPKIVSYKYDIIAGLSIGELTMNYISQKSSLKDYAIGKKRYQPALLVNQIFPDTTAYHTHVFKEGSIIKTVNGLRVTTIAELQTALTKNNNYIIIVTKDHDKSIVSKWMLLLKIFQSSNNLK